MYYSEAFRITNNEHGTRNVDERAGGWALGYNDKFDIKYVESGMENITWLKEDS